MRLKPTDDNGAGAAKGRTTISPNLTLTTIKAMHSVAFLVELTAIAWLVLTGLLGRRDRSVVVAGGLVAIESVVFVANRGVCPLTPLAEHYGARRGGVSDIFLPDVVARTIPIWATSLVVLGVSLHVRRSIASVRSSRYRSRPLSELASR